MHIVLWLADKSSLMTTMINASHATKQWLPMSQFCLKFSSIAVAMSSVKDGIAIPNDREDMLINNDASWPIAGNNG